MEEKIDPIQKKKNFPISPPLHTYLKKYGRIVHLPLVYEDLLRFSSHLSLTDQAGKDTLWNTVFYNPSETVELHESLCEIYALLKMDGNFEALPHLAVARIDYCLFGNTMPFRVRIINKLNDNYDHFYVKRADASRIYGLELEDILSPNKITYLVYKNTIIEEHIAGIPGDVFIQKNIDVSKFEQIRIAKEFVKFNERCFIRLLGDMRAYNYVVSVTPDIEGNQYRIRSIDFDQQSYEGQKNFYLPQYFKENNPIINLGIQHMTPETVKQYQLEERSLLSMRARTEHEKFSALLAAMKQDDISVSEKLESLKQQLNTYHKNSLFSSCKNMGEVLEQHIKCCTAKH